MFKLNGSVLIVDDMKTVRQIVKKNLIEMGFKQITDVVNGQEAWSLLQEKTDFEFILSDWNMPEMSGIELLKNIRSSEKTKHIPFVFLTAESDMQQVKQAVDLGADNYIVKPFSPKNLKEKLEQTYTKVTSKK